jgi:hypothetical protein
MEVFMKKEYLFLSLSTLFSVAFSGAMEKEAPILGFPAEILVKISNEVRQGENGLTDLMSLTSSCTSFKKLQPLRSCLIQTEKDTILHRALINHNPAGVYKAIKIGANVNTHNTLLHQSINNLRVIKKKKKFKKSKKINDINDMAIIMALLFNNIDINGQDDNGNTALHIAAQRKLIHVAQLLFDQGIDPNIQNNDGQTAAHITTQGKFITLLKKHNADFTLLDNNGHTCHDTYLNTWL